MDIGQSHFGRIKEVQMGFISCYLKVVITGSATGMGRVEIDFDGNKKSSENNNIMIIINY